MPNAFRDLIRLIVNGEAVNEATINRVLQDLHSNAQYIRDLFEAVALGEAVYAREQTLDALALVSQPVYYDVDDQRWKQAIATTSTTDSLITMAESARVWGIVNSKTNDTLGDLVLMGYVELDMSNAITGTVVPGQYYLDGTTAGKLSALKQPVSVPVLQAAGPGTIAGTTKVFVKTSFTDIFTSHQHYQFDLKTDPAGQAVLNTGIWTIPVPLSGVEGWLPASHSNFGGKAPAGAKFGYNISASDLDQVWPPIPSASAYLEWNQGVDVQHLGQGVPLGTAGLAIIDANGIWWYSDCENEVPWDNTGSTTTTTP